MFFLLETHSCCFSWSLDQKNIEVCILESCSYGMCHAAMPQGIPWKYGSPAPNKDEWLIWTHLDSRHHTDDMKCGGIFVYLANFWSFGRVQSYFGGGSLTYQGTKKWTWTILKSINEAACNSEISEIKGDKPPSKKAGRVVVTGTEWSFCFTWHNSQKDGLTIELLLGNPLLGIHSPLLHQCQLVFIHAKYLM